MKKLPFLLSLSVIALVFLTASASAEIPTYVEREKGIYYFRIHGGPYGAPPEIGCAEFIYKNLSPGEQTVRVTMNSIFLGLPKVYDRTFTVPIGGEITDFNRIPGDLGSIVDFALYVDGGLEASGSIIIAPP